MRVRGEAKPLEAGLTSEEGQRLREEYRHAIHRQVFAHASVRGFPIGPPFVWTAERSRATGRFVTMMPVLVMRRFGDRIVASMVIVKMLTSGPRSQRSPRISKMRTGDYLNGSDEARNRQEEWRLTDRHCA